MPSRRTLRLLLALALLPLVTACATPSGQEAEDSDTAEEGEAEDQWAEDDWEQGTWDPLEPFNRWVFAFNDRVDTYALRPAAVAYRDYVPRGVRRPIGRFLGNLREPYSAANYYLQGEVAAGTRSTARFLINTTVGVLGLFDVAGAAGLEQERTDLGLTLGRWGAPEGPYLVLPLLGPSHARATSGLAGRYLSRDYHDPLHWLEAGQGVRYTSTVLEGLDTRVDLLSLDELMAESGTDPYVFMRESYLQNRRERLGEDDWDDWDSEGGDDGWDDAEWEDSEDWEEGDDGQEDTSGD